ncbi:MAG: extracellular solute-binding protein [Treponema sp.]|nr:extracellular solute-binding protein [Treponema sp.]
MKKTIFITLGFLLLLSSMLFAGGGQASGGAASGTAAAGSIPSYINLDGYRPIVKQGTNVTLSMMIRRETIAKSDINSNWMPQFIKRILNVNLTIEETFADTYQERRNLALASNDLPDIMINQSLGPSDLVRYGTGEKMFLPLSDYFSNQLTPTINALLKDNPDGVAFNTNPDGKMYTIGNYADATRYPVADYRLFINTKWMALAGINAPPKTVDSFIDMLRKFKALNPADVGAKGKITPMIVANEHDRRYFLNALGFVGPNSASTWGTDPCINVNTKQITVPCGEPEWAEFLRIYNTMYTEGLIHQEYFTMAANRATARAQFAEGNAGVCVDAAPYVSMPDSFKDWISAVPLTSSVNQMAVAARAPNVGVGTFIVSAKTKYPEVVMRLLDWMYTPEMGYISTNGPIAGTADTLGIVGGIQLNDAKDYFTTLDVTAKKFDSDWDYRVNAIALSQETPRNTNGSYINMMKALGVPNPQLREYNLNDGDDNYYVQCYNGQNGYFYTCLPPAFLDLQQGTRAADLRSAIENHVKAETAKFVVGQRPLSEIPAYFAELKAMGFDEYKAIYTEAYKNYMANRTDWSTYRIDYK